VKHIICIM